MWGVVCALTVAMAAQVEPVTEPLTVRVQRWEGQLMIQFALATELPDELRATISSGAPAEIDYLLRVYARRKLLPDRRVFKGEAKASVTFDAITGRYICQLIVNEDTVASREADSPGEAEQWLRAPPPVEIVIPEPRQDDVIRIRVRAVFERGTTWLVFPATRGTDWVEVVLEPPLRDTEE